MWAGAGFGMLADQPGDEEAAVETESLNAWRSDGIVI